jgi:uncharacterized membrane protein (UPF0127 family)
MVRRPPLEKSCGAGRLPLGMMPDYREEAPRLTVKHRMTAPSNPWRPMRGIAPALFLLLAAISLSRPAAADSLIIHAGASAYKFQVELATTEEARARGLMFRKSMAPNAGMLFFYPAEQPVAFWMKNTLIPLDMLFIKANGNIVHIAANAVPEDETPIPSNEPVLAVLEINGGTAAALGIKEGDRVQYSGAAGSLGGN